VGIGIAPLKKGGRKSNLNRPLRSLKLAGAILWAGICTVVQARRGEPNARNEIRGSFARASRCRGYVTRVLTRVMTPIHQDASAMTEC
jgi:hypothetical protein